MLILFSSFQPNFLPDFSGSAFLGVLTSIFLMAAGLSFIFFLAGLVLILAFGPVSAFAFTLAFPRGFVFVSAFLSSFSLFLAFVFKAIAPVFVPVFFLAGDKKSYRNT